ncbi:MAG: ROK family protein [Verrucomicrobiaceae bacterium]|nr:ROK family protein [Verrucomicrobiaceae bacterium]
MKKKKILVIDIGGTHVKLMISRSEKRKFDSGTKLSPRQMIAQIKKTTEGWSYDVISIGFPAPVEKGRIMSDPKHLAPGWVGWNFQKSLGKPTRVINDAALQAVGSYRGGRMLFLGLGTGLGSTLLWNKNVLPLELGDLPYQGGIIEEVLGKPGLERLGKRDWMREVLFCLAQLKLSFIADYVVLGGGNVKQFDKLPEGIEMGHNRNAYRGGCRLWETEPGTKRPKWNII